MRRYITMIIGLSLVLTACHSSPPSTTDSSEPVPPPSPSSASPSPSPDRDASTVNREEYSLPQTELWQGFEGYWFTDEARSVRCIMATQGPAINYPYVSCDVAAEFAVRDVDKAREDCGDKAGTFQGWKAMLTDETTVMGSCQSDVPIGMMCSQLAGTGESEFCDEEWFSVPVLPEGETLNVGTFSCVVTGTQVRCISESGQEMTIPPSD